MPSYLDERKKIKKLKKEKKKENSCTQNQFELINQRWNLFQAPKECFILNLPSIILKQLLHKYLNLIAMIKKMQGLKCILTDELSLFPQTAATSFTKRTN